MVHKYDYFVTAVNNIYGGKNIKHKDITLHLCQTQKF